MRLTVPLEIDIDTTSLKEGENMKLSVSGSLSISGQVFVSGGAVDAIAEAVAASQDPIYFDPAGYATPWVDETGLISLTSQPTDDGNGNTVTLGRMYEDQTATGLNFPASRDIWIYYQGTDSTGYFYTEGRPLNPGVRAGVVSTVSGAIDAGVGTPSYFVDGVAVPRDALDLYNAMCDGNPHILRIAGVAAGGTANQDTVGFYGTGGGTTNSDGFLTGKGGVCLSVDAQTTESADAITAQLAARYGITL